MKKRMPFLYYGIAGVCAVYCLGIVLTKAAGTKFFLVWIAAAAGFILLGFILQKGLWERLPGPAKAACLGAVCLGLLWFLFVEGLIISAFGAKGEAGLSYIVVLGAQIKPNGPSVALARRLDRAYQYLQDNPDTLCVVSGGQGSNEPVSEAQGMYEYLVEKGIGAERIILEDTSQSTVENLVNSRKLIPDDITKVGVVTSNFHVYRGVQLAKKQGFEDAVGIAAPSGFYFLPNNMLREFCGVMKDRMFGNLKFFGAG